MFLDAQQLEKVRARVGCESLCITAGFGQGVTQGLHGGVVRTLRRADLEDGGVVRLSRRTLFDLAFFDLRAGFCQVQVDLLGAGTEGVAQRLETLHLLEQTLLGDGGFLGEFLRIGA